ncbi:uncharacterized protein K452DRAFT_230804 [Aplosporella prunicola CBS 121167]|uniref:Mmc1 C-terminal domain-containing protein n=1 Tax=Aplosporella prunicola CBS 121167 TaxID=1176127 RepID=A0A6A6B9S2_9PEZI|nr:uncharacterized protein K452DRAFT_230804 [Aplosporella prunicola CBS 121167]KAF2140113.1 hypothetical protein K452DRAFT_230804 [Aplosporella prunicola CBS 121167]
MPPRIPPATKLPPSDLFFCPSCSLWRLGDAPSCLSAPAAARTRAQFFARRRHAATLASRTAINAPVDVPPRLKELHQTLDALKGPAANYVNLSRLQLALRGLETTDPVVRIAVLSLGDQRAAQRLVRLLLADPLGDKGVWEKELEKKGQDEAQAILLRHGDETDVHPYNPLLRTISVPSRILQKHNIEILISSLNVNTAAPSITSEQDRPKDAILVPTLRTPTSASGRLTMVTYPVHRAIVFGDGVKSTVAYGRFTATQAEQDIPAQTVKVALGLPAPAEEVDQSSTDRYVVIDPELATEAIEKFRESIANSMIYERGWHRSGLHVLTKWLAEGAAPADMKPALENLIKSLLADAHENIKIDDAQRLQELANSAISEATKAEILESLRVWAEHAHNELREKLDMAFASKYWHKIAWWKLLWRVDDVGMITSDILERRWLTEAEKEIVWVAGRIEEAGFFAGDPQADAMPERRMLKSTAVPVPRLGELPDGPPRLSELRKYDARPADDIDAASLPELKPWPMQIPLARAHLSATGIPPLQALAQKLLLQTASTTTMTGALSALTYVSFSGVSAFEAGAVAALGAVWSLRRMQRVWEGARARWAADVRERGREALKDTEVKVRDVVRERGAAKVDWGAGDERTRAREAVARARYALARVVGR